MESRTAFPSTLRTLLPSHHGRISNQLGRFSCGARDLPGSPQPASQAGEFPIPRKTEAKVPVPLSSYNAAAGVVGMELQGAHGKGFAGARFRGAGISGAALEGQGHAATALAAWSLPQLA